MATNFSPVQAQKFKLAGAGITSAATTIVLKSFKTPDSTNILTANFGALGLLVIDPGTSREETVSFTTVTQNADGTASLTGVTRGLGFIPPYSETTALKLSHSGGSIAVLSNPAALYGKYTSKANDEAITGYWTVPTPLGANDVVNKAYADALAMTGTGVSTDSLKVAGIAGETVAAGQIIYLREADGRWWLADADLIATIDGVQIGVAQGAGTAGNNITGGVLLRGVDSNQSGLTAGTKYYLSNTAGGISSSVGTLTRAVGNAKTTTSLYFDVGENVNASTTAKGVSEEATQAQVSAGTATGETGARLFVNPSTAVASTTDRGMVEEATQAEVDAGTAAGGSGARLFINPSTQRTPFFQQSIPMEGQTGTNWQGSSSNQDGSVLIVNTGLTNELFRYERDSATGMYLMTHNVSSTAASSFACVTVLGNYVYLFYDGGNNVSCYRYDLATLANETVMTVPSLDTSTANYTVGCYNDGTSVYVTQNKASTTTNKWSLSDTTFSAVSTATSSGLSVSVANMYDGTTVYLAISNNSVTYSIYKLTNVDGSSKTTTSKSLTLWSDTGGGAFLLNIDTTKMYFGRLETVYDEVAAVKGVINLVPITKL